MSQPVTKRTPRPSATSTTTTTTTKAASPDESNSSSSVGLAKYASQCTTPTKPLPSSPHVHDTLKILTWNCWFDQLYMKERMDAIGSVIQAESPHVVALQEVNELSLRMIQRSAWFKEYYVTDRSHATYWTLLCTKFPPINPRRLPFQSKMHRDLLCMNIDVPTSLGNRRLTIGTSHLESEFKRKEPRRHQLEKAFKHLSQQTQRTSTAIFCGDMNLYGSEAADILAQFGWTDGWLTLNPRANDDDREIGEVFGSSASLHSTYDTMMNGMIASRPTQDGNAFFKNSFQGRYDRFFLRLGSGKKESPGQQKLLESKESDWASTPAPLQRRATASAKDLAQIAPLLKSATIPHQQATTSVSTTVDASITLPPKPSDDEVDSTSNSTGTSLTTPQKIITIDHTPILGPDKDAVEMKMTSAAASTATSSDSSTTVASESIATPSSLSSSPLQSTPSTPAANPDWRPVSIERIGLCRIDLTQPQLYGKSNYKAFDSDSNTVSAAAAANEVRRAARASPKPAPPVVFPSDHFGLVMTIQLNN